MASPDDAPTTTAPASAAPPPTMTVTAAVGRSARSESPAASWCLAAGDIPWEYAPAAQARSIAQRPEWIAAFLEMKTVWHPVGV